MVKKKLKPVHPGEVLCEEFLNPLDLSVKSFAKALHVTPRRINELVAHKCGITADTSLRLGKYFGNSAEFWMSLQMDYDLDVARLGVGAKIEKDVNRLRHNSESKTVFNSSRFNVR